MISVEDPGIRITRRSQACSLAPMSFRTSPAHAKSSFRKSKIYSQKENDRAGGFWDNFNVKWWAGVPNCDELLRGAKASFTYHMLLLNPEAVLYIRIKQRVEWGIELLQFANDTGAWSARSSSDWCPWVSLWARGVPEENMTWQPGMGLGFARTGHEATKRIARLPQTSIRSPERVF